MSMSRTILLVLLCCALAAAAQAQPVLTASSQTNVSCNGGSNGAAAVNAATGGTPPYAYNWTPGNPTGDGTTNVTGLTAGSWTCTVTDSASATDFVTFTITQPTALVVTPASQTNVSCNGGSNGAASIFPPTGGAGGYTYNWTPGNPTGDGTTSVTGLTAGTWTCTVTDANSCTTTQTFTITQPTALVVTPASQTNVSCNGGSNGAASINTPTGGAGGYTYNWTPGNPTGDGTTSVTGLTAGTWTVAVTDANSCTATQTFNVTQPTALNVTPASQTNVACNGGSSGAASINTPTGGAGGYTYNWTPGNPMGDGTTSVTGLTAGTWTVTVTDANSCTATQTFNITQPTALNVTPASQTNVSCNGGSNGAASINTPTGGAGGYTYNWTPGNPTGDGTTSVSGLTAGTWTVTVTDANSCTATQTFNITQPTAIAVTPASQTNIACFGGSNGAASINTPTGGAGGYTYNWTPGNPTGDGTTSVTGLTAGTWTVTVTDANSCTATQTFNVTQPTALTASTSQTSVSCNGGSNGAATVVPSGGTAPYSYSWSPSGGTAATATGLSAGTYTCTITDANSCTLTRTVTITQPPALGASTSQTNVACNGGTNGSASVLVSGGTPGYTYTWAPSGGTAAIASGLAAGNYTVTVTDANSCTLTRTFSLTEPPAIAVAPASQTNVSCDGGTNGSASVSASGGAGSLTYSWAPSGGTAATASGLGAGTYTVTVTDANGCTGTQTFNVTQPAALTVSPAAQTNISCNGGTNGSATVSASGGTPSYAYSWAPSGGTTATASSLAAGTYTCTVTDANSCTTTQTFNITQPATLTVSSAAQTNNTCNGGANGSATVSVSGGTPAYTYAWAPAGGTAATASGLTSGTYTCTVTDANGCTGTQTFSITEPVAIVMTAASQTNLSCNGGANGAASVNAATGGSGGFSYDWMPGSPAGDGTTSVTGLTAGTWTCTVTDAAGCAASQTFAITAPSALVASAASTTNLSCNGAADGAATVSASGGTGSYLYAWTPSGGTGATASALAAGNYTVTVTDAASCTTTQTFAITQPAILTAMADSVDPTGPGACDGSVAAFVSGGTAPYIFAWSPGGESTASVGSLCEGSYDVLVTDAMGCTANATATLTDPATTTPPDPKIVVTGCATLGEPCTLTAESISGVSQAGWAYTWRINSVGAGSTRTITPSLPTPGAYDATVEAIEAGLTGVANASFTLALPCPAGLLCLQAGRFEVALTAMDPRTGATAAGVPLHRNNLYGLFTLPRFTGSEENPEVFIKIIDGRPVNGQWWFFFGGLTDLEYTLAIFDKDSGESRNYTKPGGSAAGGFDVGGGVKPEKCVGEVDGTAAGTTATGACVAAADRLCLLGGRFSLRLAARDQRTGATANGVAFPQGELFGHFALPGLTGEMENPEVFVKMLDGRVVNTHFWLFFAGLTDLEYTLEVTDMTNGIVKIYTKLPGSACGAFDTNGW